MVTPTAAVSEIGTCDIEQVNRNLGPQKRPHLAGSDLLQGILALGEARILHDDHDDRHLLVDECQGPVLQLSSQDTF